MLFLLLFQKKKTFRLSAFLLGEVISELQRSLSQKQVLGNSCNIDAMLAQQLSC